MDMTALDFVIYGLIGGMIFVSYLVIIQTLSIEIGIGLFGILVAGVLYFFSVRGDKRSMLIIMTLIDHRRRNILECLEKPKTIDDLEIAVNKMGITMSRPEISDLLNSLEKRKFVRRISDSEGTKYERKF
jgi:hypothetical protein